MSKHQVLYDLSMGHNSVGFSGIPQDTRFLFANLTNNEKIVTSITHDSRMFRIKSSCKFIIRYHYAIPLFISDTMPSHNTTNLHYSTTKNCESAIFVCNSPNSRDELNIISPKAAEDAHIIPYFLPIIRKGHKNVERFSRSNVLPMREDLFDELNCKDKK